MPRQPIAGERLQWADLTTEARAAIEGRFGAVLDVESAPPGLTPGVAAWLSTQTGDVFLKAIPQRSPALAHYKRERLVNQVLPGDLAPRLLWSAEIGGWLSLVFQRLAGRHVDLRPGSRDVDDVLDTLALLVAELTPAPWTDAPCITERLNAIRDRVAAAGTDPGGIDLDALRGNTLAHWDIHDGNLLVADGRVRVLDWSLACRAAPWVDIARLVPRLIAAGHSPRDAEATAARVPAWSPAPPDAVTALAHLIGNFAYTMAATGPNAFAAQRRRIAQACATWVQYRT